MRAACGLVEVVDRPKSDGGLFEERMGVRERIRRLMGCNSILHLLLCIFDIEYVPDKCIVA